jgi:uncharacterized metal-binding protein
MSEDKTTADGRPKTADTGSEGGKVLIIPCSGIGKAYGSVAREAAYVVIEDLRPGITETVCLSLLTMGDEETQRLVRENPTITIDGCPTACAKVNVEKSGGDPAAHFRVFDVFRAHRELRVNRASDIGDNGRRMAQILGEEIATTVDEIRNGGK